MPARALVLADAGEDHGREVAVAGIARVDGEQALDFGEGGRGLVAPVQQDGELVARGHEARRELEGALEQVLRVVVAADAHGDLGEHADRRHVGRGLVQVRLEKLLGLRDVVAVHGDRGQPQPRAFERRLDRLH